LNIKNSKNIKWIYSKYQKKIENIKCSEQSLCFQAEQNGMQNEYEKTVEENLC